MMVTLTAETAEMKRVVEPLMGSPVPSHSSGVPTDSAALSPSSSVTIVMTVVITVMKKAAVSVFVYGKMKIIHQIKYLKHTFIGNVIFIMFVDYV